MALRALLFDCDGVIAETERDGHRISFNKAFEEMGINAHWDEEEYGRLLEVGGGKERMASYFGKDPIKYPPKKYNAELIAQLHKLKTELFLKMCDKLPPRPGVGRLMREAADAGIDVFVCSTSNEKSVGAIVKSLLGKDTDRIIKKIFAGDMVKTKKPAPDIYLKINEEFQIPPEECFVFEDTRIGLLAAKAAGMKCMITVSIYSRGEDFTEADAVVDDLGDITLDTVKELLKAGQN